MELHEIIIYWLYVAAVFLAVPAIGVLYFWVRQWMWDRKRLLWTEARGIFNAYDKDLY
tara:strand:- start:3513 stop:3686 length:174 start_codon:yes stop_codon:yes gene_type:complete